ncbi:hypothetical protein ACFOYW_14860 [Gryllotalpicola reticulitermitis]|uniref:Uncharacterized protein n=1 Tax=Gryllotalpicola reticulitermitis TaxID=1184153 RepID=A0ABV8Q9L7_9MICO
MRGLPQGVRLTAPIVVGVLAGAVSWYLGAALWWAVAFALLAAALTLGWRALPHIEGPIWPQRAPQKDVGGRDDVQVLGWALTGKRGRVQSRAVDRARTVARERLSFYGLDLDEASDRDRVIALIGARPYATLHSNVANMPSQRAMLSCLDALDALALPTKENR